MRIDQYNSHGLKKKNRSRFWFAAGGAFLLGAFFIGAIYFILHSPWLAVRDFSAPELPGISGRDILDSLKIEMLGNYVRAMLGPKNILFWKWGDHPESLYRFPALKNLSVEASFWKRSVKVSAEERRLWGVVCNSPGSTCFGVDENGIVFSRVPEVFGFLLLRINDVNNRVFIPGQPLFSRQAWFSNFKKTVDILNESGFRVIGIKSMNTLSREWEAQILGKPDFYFNLSFVPDNLDSVLKGLDSSINLSKASYVDFRIPTRIYYR
jgi:hypothetical protein